MPYIVEELPPGWASTTVGDICDKPEYGWTTKAVKDGSGVKLLRTTDISKGTINWAAVPACEQEPPSADKYLLKRGDIVVSRAGSVGLSALIGDCPKAFFASYLIRFRALKGISVEFLQFFLQSPSYWEQIAKESAGIALQNVNAKKLAALILPLAPLHEQHRIVAEIETQFTRLDASEAALKRAQANLKRYRASVLKAACEGKLVPTEADLAQAEGRDYEHADQLLERILAERRARWEAQEKRRGKYKEPATPDASDLPDLPEGWTWGTIAQIGEIGEQTVLTGPFGTNLKKEDFTLEGTPVVTIGCLTEDGLDMEKAAFVSREKANELNRYSLRRGDLLFSRMATVGRAGIVGPEADGCLFNYHNMRLRLDRSTLLPQFYLAYVRGSPQVGRYVNEVNHGATRDGINTRQLLEMPVTIPPLCEQRSIVAEVERRLSIIQQAEATVEASLVRVERLRQSILKQAFSGQLVPQDPNDEPASVLLERIKAEREAARLANSNRRKPTRRRSKK